MLQIQIHKKKKKEDNFQFSFFSTLFYVVNIPWRCIWVLGLVLSLSHSQQTCLSFTSGVLVLVLTQCPVPTRLPCCCVPGLALQSFLDQLSSTALLLFLIFLVWVLLEEVHLVCKKKAPGSLLATWLTAALCSCQQQLQTMSACMLVAPCRLLWEYNSYTISPTPKSL